MNAKSRFSIFNTIRNVFFSEMGIGISANITLLFQIFVFFFQHRLKPTDLTVGHLALVHTVMLITVWFMSADMQDSPGAWDDLKCKVIIYTYRVMRGLSICSTCLLSVTQAITLSPRSSCLAKFKYKSSWQSLCSFSFLWFLNMFTRANLLFSAIASFNMTSADFIVVTESCSLSPLSNVLKDLFSVLVTFQDMSFIVLMALSSGYMVTLLCRHKRQTQHLHSTSLSSRASPEERATHIILWLMTFFVIIYCFDSIMSFYLLILGIKGPIYLTFQMLINNGYATISPLVIIGTEK